MTGSGAVPRPPGKAAGDAGAQLRELTERALLQQFAPAGALVNERGDILYLHGRTGQYLEPAPGEAGMNILKMAREGLRARLDHRPAQSGGDKENRCAMLVCGSRPTAISPASI